MSIQVSTSLTHRVTLGRRDAAWGRSKLAGFPSSLSLSPEASFLDSIRDSNHPLSEASGSLLHNLLCPLTCWILCLDRMRSWALHPRNLAYNLVYTCMLCGEGIPGSRTRGVGGQAQWWEIPKECEPGTFSLLFPTPTVTMPLCNLATVAYYSTGGVIERTWGQDISHKLDFTAVWFGASHLPSSLSFLICKWILKMPPMTTLQSWDTRQLTIWKVFINCRMLSEHHLSWLFLFQEYFGFCFMGTWASDTGTNWILESSSVIERQVGTEQSGFSGTISRDLAPSPLWEEGCLSFLRAKGDKLGDLPPEFWVWPRPPKGDWSKTITLPFT